MSELRRWTSTFARLGLLTFSITATACTPLAAPAPWHFAETAAALAPGHVAVTAVGGVGGAGFDGAASGGGARLRVGVGGGQEVGVEGTMIAVDQNEQPSAEKPWVGPSASWGAKLSWKQERRSWLAVIGGLGGTRSATGLAAGGDVGLVFSSGHPLRGIITPYGAGRLSVAVPVDHAIAEAGGITGMLLAAVGGALELRPARLFLEGGMMYAGNYGYPVTTASMSRVEGYHGHLGVYAIVGVSFEFVD